MSAPGLKPKTIDEYLAHVPAPKRAALERLRAQIKAAAPKAEECISYGLAAFRQDGMLVGFGATENHCAFYLMSGSIVAAHPELLEAYDTSKGTIRFQADEPLPAALVKTLVKARLAENTELRGAAKAPKAKAAKPTKAPKAPKAKAVKPAKAPKAKAAKKKPSKAAR